MEDGEPHRHLRDASAEVMSIAVGELYEDCSYEPMLCVLADYEADELTGISLVNGRVGSCSPTHCGVRKLSLREAVEIRGTWPPAHIVEWSGANNVALRMQGETISSDRVRPGAVSLAPEQLRHILNRLG
jgi:hypothetical protein